MDTNVTPADLRVLLETNGYPAAAADLAAGKTYEAALGPILNTTPLYEDDEGYWLLDLAAALVRGDITLEES